MGEQRASRSSSAWPCAALSLAAQSLPAPGPRAQDSTPLIERLRAGADQDRIVAELRRLGPRATSAVAERLAAAQGRELTALANALAELPGSAAAVPRLLAAIPSAPVADRDPLLHALGNCVLADGEDGPRDAVAGALAEWARQGLFYSPSATQPTFAWYEYVRLRRRLALCREGTDVPGLARYLARIRRGRTEIAGFRGTLGNETPPDQVGNVGSFGQHGTREELEAIAELALRSGLEARDVAVELWDYLRHETPRAGQTLTEHCAGIGETAPADDAGAKLPTLWRRDDWRFACARAVLALDPAADHRRFALRHLLHAKGATERIETLAAVRAAPPPWHELAPDLAALLDDRERLVVRDALVTIALADGEVVAAARERLERIAAGTDAELAMLARRALRAR